MIKSAFEFVVVFSEIVKTHEIAPKSPNLVQPFIAKNMILAVSKEEVASAQLPSPPPSVIYHDRRGSLSQHSSVDRSPSHTLMSTSNTSDPDNPRFDHLANDSDYAYVSPRENPMISSNHGSYYMQNNPQHHDFQGDSTPVNEVSCMYEFLFKNKKWIRLILE